MRTAELQTKILRKVKIAHIPVVKAGKVESMQFAEINGALLVPVTDAHLFNTSASTIRRMIRDGRLTGYHGNGQVKTGNGSEKVYFDLHSYLALDNNN